MKPTMLFPRVNIALLSLQILEIQGSYAVDIFNLVVLTDSKQTFKYLNNTIEF